MRHKTGKKRRQMKQIEKGGKWRRREKDKKERGTRGKWERKDKREEIKVK